MGPKTVMMIRHGEKPGKDGARPLGVEHDGVADGDSLSPRGWQRAGALVRFFNPGMRPVADTRLAVPQALFAMAPKDTSKRPHQTLRPLAEDMGLPIDTHVARDDIASLVEAINLCAGPALVCWEHHRIPHIAALLTDGANLTPDWAEDRFDMVWLFEHRDDAWRFEQVPQLLLAGDRPDAM